MKAKRFFILFFFLILLYHLYNDTSSTNVLPLSLPLYFGPNLQLSRHERVCSCDHQHIKNNSNRERSKGRKIKETGN